MRTRLSAAGRAVRAPRATRAIGAGRTTVRVLVALPASAAAMLLPAACSSADDPAPIPAGHVRFTGDGYTFVHPKGWVEERTKDGRGAPVIALHGPRGAQNAYRGEVTVGRHDRYRRSMRDQLVQARAMNMLYRRTIVVDRTERVPGAAQAHRIEAVYDDTAPDGTRMRVRVVDIYALSEKGTLFDFVARARDADFTVVGMPGLIRSVQVRS